MYRLDDLSANNHFGMSILVLVLFKIFILGVFTGLYHLYRDFSKILKQCIFTFPEQMELRPHFSWYCTPVTNP